MPIVEMIALNTLQLEITNPLSTALIGHYISHTKCKIINTILIETKWRLWKSRNCINYEQKFTDIKLMLLDIKTASLDQLKWPDNCRSVELVEELFIV